MTKTAWIILAILGGAGAIVGVLIYLKKKPGQPITEVIRETIITPAPAQTRWTPPTNPVPSPTTNPGSQTQQPGGGGIAGGGLSSMGLA